MGFIASLCAASHWRDQDCGDWLEENPHRGMAQQRGIGVLWILKDGEVVPRKISALWEVRQRCAVSRGVRMAIS